MAAAQAPSDLSRKNVEDPMDIFDRAQMPRAWLPNAEGRHVVRGRILIPNAATRQKTTLAVESSTNVDVNQLLAMEVGVQSTQP